MRTRLLLRKEDPGTSGLEQWLCLRGKASKFMLSWARNTCSCARPSRKVLLLAKREPEVSQDTETLEDDREQKDRVSGRSEASPGSDRLKDWIRNGSSSIIG